MYRIAEELIRVADLLVAFEFPSKEALEEYLKSHPAADKKKHWVKEQKEKHKEESKTETVKSIEGNPPWKEKEEQLFDKISHEPIKYEKSRGEHVNTAYFETYKDGTKSVWKPDEGSAPLGNWEGKGGNEDDDDEEALRFTLSNDVSQGKREAVGYQLDKILGLDVVPPTVYTEKSKGGKGSSQLFVEGKGVHKMGDNMEKVYDKASPELKLSIQKVALFDVITGNTDRHNGNIFISPKQDKAYAIDNGLILPNEAVGKDESGRQCRYDASIEFFSEPYSVIQHKVDRKAGGTFNPKPFDESLIKPLATIDKDAFMGILTQNNLAQEATFAWKRVEQILEDYGMKHTGPQKGKTEEPKKENEPKPEDLRKLKESLGKKGKKLTNKQLLIIFNKLAKGGWFEKGKAEKTMGAIEKLIGKGKI